MTEHQHQAPSAAGGEGASQLKRGLGARHIQMIAIGGAIGTGLFLGSASRLHSTGPALTPTRMERSGRSQSRSTSAQRGRTSTKSSKPMVFMARAAAPTLPAWLVSIKTKRVFIIIAQHSLGLGS